MTERIRIGHDHGLHNGPLARLLLPEHGLLVFTVITAVTFGVLPLVAYLFFIPSEQYLRLAILTSVAVGGLALGGVLPLFDHRFDPTASRVRIPPAAFHAIIWTVFGAFCVVTFATAQHIPILSALKGGASPDELSSQRGEFLKGRQGAGLILLYLSTFLVNTVLPYSTVLLYKTKSPLRHVCGALFFLFCISFMQKTLFLTLALPLLTYLAITNRLTARRLAFGFAVTIALIVVQTYLSLDSDVLAAQSGGNAAADYLASDYTPRNPIMYSVWRAFAVPIFTAVDTLIVHTEYFGGRMLLGATSTLLAALFGLQRINLERFVSEYQFGGWNDLANSNAVFIVDAYANFGFVGVLLFSITVGQIFRWFRLSRDVGFASLWPLFAFGIFNASLIGVFFSNGFLYMFAHAMFAKVARAPTRHVQT